jgi:hypothetical protein
LHETEGHAAEKIKISRARDSKAEWWPDGFFIPPWGGPPWLWIYSRAADRVLGLRPSQLMGQGALLAIVPDAGFWRGHFKQAGDIDWQAAAAAVIAACYAAGERPAPTGFALRGPGRPKKIEAR